MPTTSPASYSSRPVSTSSFSMNGSPTWTEGRRCSAPSSNVAEASTDTPPPPVGGRAGALPVPADAGDHARQHPRGVRVIGRAEPQRVHHADRPRAHGEDVADDAADARGGTLVRLDEARV